MAETPNIVEQAGHTLNSKVLGLPVWADILIVIGLGGAVYLFVLKPSGIAAPAASSIPGIGAPSGTFGAPGPTGPTTPTGPTYTTNSDWMNAAVAAVQKALGSGFSAAEIQLYLTDYLNGTAPQGSAHASGLFQQVIQLALQLVGPPPQQPVIFNPTNNQFTTNQQWLTSVLSLIPGVSQTDVQQIQALFAGTTTKLTQSAATLLQQMIDLLGLPPTTIPQYTITNQPGGPGSTYSRPLFNNSFSTLLTWLGQVGYQNLNPTNLTQGFLQTWQGYSSSPAWNSFVQQELGILMQGYRAGLVGNATWWNDFQSQFYAAAHQQGFI